MNHSSLSAREDSPGGERIAGRGESKPSGGGASLGRTKERTAVYPSAIPQISIRNDAWAEEYLVLREKA